MFSRKIFLCGSFSCRGLLIVSSVENDTYNTFSRKVFLCESFFLYGSVIVSSVENDTSIHGILIVFSRSNVVTEDIGKLFVKKPNNPSSAH